MPASRACVLAPAAEVLIKHLRKSKHKSLAAVTTEEQAVAVAHSVAALNNPRYARCQAPTRVRVHTRAPAEHAPLAAPVGVCGTL